MTDNYKVSKAPKPITPLKGIRQTRESKTILHADYETWSKHDLWTVERGILLLLNAEELPSRDSSTGRCNSDDEQRLYEAFLKIWGVAESSLQAGALKKIDKGPPSLINNVLPAAFISWAQSKGYQIPAELNDLTKATEQEPQAEAVEKLSFDDELNSILDASLHDNFNELKQRNEAPYDGVLGCPPNLVTENEKERFISIRNRLLDKEGFSVADISGLINDCNAKSNSYSLIPDKLKQDIRFLASLWRSIQEDDAQPEVVVGKTKQGKKRTRKDNLGRAIDAAISQLGKKPSFEELWKYFQNDRDETGFIEDYTDTCVTWRDTKGNFHDTPKESLANRLSRVKS